MSSDIPEEIKQKLVAAGEAAGRAAAAIKIEDAKKALDETAAAYASVTEGAPAPAAEAAGEEEKEDDVDQGEVAVDEDEDEAAAKERDRMERWKGSPAYKGWESKGSEGDAPKMPDDFMFGGGKKKKKRRGGKSQRKWKKMKKGGRQSKKRR